MVPDPAEARFFARREIFQVVVVVLAVWVWQEGRSAAVNDPWRDSAPLFSYLNIYRFSDA
ncbi:hypothetical protein F8A10_19680 (plasmid) [Paracoccus kondratievae]|uniref:hypothetical protein n=1 Tax=Paracoccus kondratievae TaxID=135740 RepID=UPI0012667B5A|nr:hypothetical protein [Paracoccus kondratievae]QFQ89658.1 hypothetical protein F8A10_19680 [Paracoccus kondratievae]